MLDDYRAIGLLLLFDCIALGFIDASLALQILARHWPAVAFAARWCL